jgi:hypothetical protein
MVEHRLSWLGSVVTWTTWLAVAAAMLRVVLS